MDRFLGLQLSILICVVSTMGCGYSAVPTASKYTRSFSSQTPTGPSVSPTAYCNRFSVPDSTFFVGTIKNIQQGSVWDDNKISMKITEIANSWFSFPNTAYIKIRKVSFTTGAAELVQFNLSAEVLSRNPALIQILNQMQTGFLNPSFIQALQQGGLSPFPTFIIENTRGFEALEIVIGGSPASSTPQYVLIPKFEADPAQFKKRLPSLINLHPFTLDLGLNLDFGALANQLCF
ncbi:MAG: hypothetical protein IT289_01525 [Oligoflexia bacterium]|nr:hypothetical protein [Oligoflexia bacterium]